MNDPIYLNAEHEIQHIMRSLNIWDVEDKLVCVLNHNERMC